MKQEGMSIVFRMVVPALAAASAFVATAPARAAWQEASSVHFVVYSDDTPEAVRAFTARLEQYDKALHVMRGLKDETVSPASRVTVFVVKNTSVIEKLAKDDNVAGFYIPRAEGSVAFTPRSSGDGSQTALTAQQVLLHEYAHHITFFTFGHTALPPWYVEGFAEFHATARFESDGGMTFGAPPLYRGYTMLNLTDLPLAKLLSVDPNRLPPMERDIFYGRAWLLTHYLNFDEARRHQLTQYIQLINEGKSPAQAAAVFGDLRKLDVELNKYARAPKIAAIKLSAASLPIGPVTVRTLTPAEAAAMPALILSKRGVDAKSAPGVLAQARAAAASFPADPFVQNELAEAEYDAGHYAESETATAKVTAVDPKSVHAIMYKGMARMAIATKAKDTRPATWQDVRHWFSLANHLDPDDPWPLAMYYRSYAAAGQSPTPNAEAGVIFAHALAPFDGGLGLEVAAVYLRQGKPDEARTALKPVAFNPHGGAAATLATATLAALDKGGAPAALAVIDAKPDPSGVAQASGNGADGGHAKPAG